MEMTPRVSITVGALLMIALALLPQAQAGSMRIRLKSGYFDGNGGKDLFVKFWVDGVTRTRRSSTEWNTDNAQWNEWIDFGRSDIPSQGTLRFSLYDYDTFWFLETSEKLRSRSRDFDFNGCQQRTRSINIDNQNFKIFFDIEYTPINPCAAGNGGCDHQCNCISDNYKQCTCFNGYAPVADTCQEIDNCQNNNGGCDSTTTTCRKTGPGTHVCDCLAAHERVSSTTCAAINWCEKNPVICGANSVCTFTGPDSYDCSCQQGYESASGSFCTAINPCNRPSGDPHLQDCTGNTICEYISPGQAMCRACGEGYTSEGGDCLEVDPCEETPGICGNNAECAFTGPGQHECSCHSGYEPDPDSLEFSCLPINACDDAVNPCGANSLCTATGPAAFKCTCQSGYDSPTGKDCAPIDPCETNNGGCGDHSSCDYTGPNERVCVCHPGYHSPSGEGTDCEEINPCLQDNGGCGNTTTTLCTHTGPNQRTCTCREGYTSLNHHDCFPINPCASDELNTCDAATQRCLYTGPGTHTCECLPGFEKSDAPSGACEPIGCGGQGPCPVNSICVNDTECFCIPPLVFNEASECVDPPTTTAPTSATVSTTTVTTTPSSTMTSTVPATTTTTAAASSTTAATTTETTATANTTPTPTTTTASMATTTETAATANTTPTPTTTTTVVEGTTTTTAAEATGSLATAVPTGADSSKAVETAGPSSVSPSPPSSTSSISSSVTDGGTNSTAPARSSATPTTNQPAGQSKSQASMTGAATWGLVGGGAGLVLLAVVLVLLAVARRRARSQRGGLGKPQARDTLTPDTHRVNPVFAPPPSNGLFDQSDNGGSATEKRDLPCLNPTYGRYEELEEPSSPLYDSASGTGDGSGATPSRSVDDGVDTATTTVAASPASSHPASHPPSRGEYATPAVSTNDLTAGAYMVPGASSNPTSHPPSRGEYVIPARSTDDIAARTYMTPSNPASNPPSRGEYVTPARSTDDMAVRTYMTPGASSEDLYDVPTPSRAASLQDLSASSSQNRGGRRFVLRARQHAERSTGASTASIPTSVSAAASREHMAPSHEGGSGYATPRVAQPPLPAWAEGQTPVSLAEVARAVGSDRSSRQQPEKDSQYFMPSMHTRSGTQPPPLPDYMEPATQSPRRDHSPEQEYEQPVGDATYDNLVPGPGGAANNSAEPHGFGLYATMKGGPVSDSSYGLLRGLPEEQTDVDAPAVYDLPKPHRVVASTRAVSNTDVDAPAVYDLPKPHRVVHRGSSEYAVPSVDGHSNTPSSRPDLDV